MAGIRVGPHGVARRRAAECVALVGIAVLLLLPSAVLGGTAPPMGARGAPLPAASSVGTDQMRAALASLTPAANRSIDPTPWTNLTPGLAHSPSAREGEALVYDPSGGYVLLFGGATGAGSVHDTWTFANGTWTNISAKVTVHPSSRYKAVVAYDPATGDVVLFGGRSSLYFNDTWLWNGTTWTHVPTPVAPAPREDAVMAYDPVDQYLVLFGGEIPSLALQNDTWSFHAGAWTNITAQSTARPPTREAGGMTFDSTDGYVLLFGGSNDPRGDLKDTWSFLGGTWTNRTVSGKGGPQQRETLMLADDPVDGFVLLFGGLHFPNTLNDEWAYSQGIWTQLVTPTAPPVRWGGEVAWDQNGGFGFVLLFGGVSGAAVNASLYGDTWTFKIPLVTTLQLNGSSTLDVGLSTSLVANASGGYAPYSFSWQNLPTGCIGGNATTVPCTPTAPGIFPAQAVAQDASGGTNASPPITLTVHADPSILGRESLTAGDSPLAVGFTSNVTGGTAPFTFVWTLGNGATDNTSTTSLNYTYDVPGNYTPTVTVVDALGVNASDVLSMVEVGPPAIALTLTAVASPLTGDAPLLVSFGADPAGGVTPYNFNWSFGVPGATSQLAAPSYTYTSAGSYVAVLNVTDAANEHATFSATITVSPAPIQPLQVVASATPSAGASPLSVAFAAATTGGVAPYTYSWQFGPSGATAATAAPSYLYTTAGTFEATVVVTDSVGTTASSTVKVTVSTPTPPALAASFTSSLGNPYCVSGNGLQQLNVSATASGGTAPYTYAWALPGWTGGGPDNYVVVAAATTVEVTLVVTDAVGAHVNVDHNVTTDSVSCPSTSGSGGSTTSLLILILILLVAVVICIEVVLLVRRRKP